tara:strand:+ start:12327 stop:12560 length:234 start_codon:yes stop_codon:yes gene_type:complete
MSNTEQIKIPQGGVITHRTTKTAKGFSYTVEMVSYGRPNMLLKTVDGFSSRAIATNRGKARKSYFNACRKNNILASL